MVGDGQTLFLRRSDRNPPVLITVTETPHRLTKGSRPCLSLRPWFDPASTSRGWASAGFTPARLAYPEHLMHVTNLKTSLGGPASLNDPSFENGLPSRHRELIPSVGPLATKAIRQSTHY